MISEVANKIYHTIITFCSWWWQVDNQQDELARTILTISVPTLVFLWYKWMSSFYTTNANASLPPGPYGLPVFGYLPFLGSNLHEQFTEMAHKYGPIFSLRLGSQLHIVVNSVDLVKVVTLELDKTFANRCPPLTALAISYGGSDITFSKNQTHWRNMRKLLVSQVMSNKNINACQSLRTHEVRRTVNEVYTKIGKMIDINKVTFDMEFNLVTSMLWGYSKSGKGKDSSYIGDRFREVVFKMIELLGAPNISDFLPALSWLDLQGKQRDTQRQLEFVDRFFDNIIEDRIKVNSSKIKGEKAHEEDGRKDLLQILLELKEQKDDPTTSINIIHIKALLLDIILATTDPTSKMVEWVMAEILNNPIVMIKVQDELEEVGMNNILEEFHLPKLKYLDAVIKETFRVHTPLPILIQRCPDESCIVGGYTIPKGTIVYMNVWAIHRDPKIWENPLEFKPERFLNEKWDYNGNNLQFLPFGSGRRVCPGIPLGEKLLMYLLASLLHFFDWSLPKNEEFELSDEFGFVTKKRKPLIVIPSQRLSDASFYIG